MPTSRFEHLDGLRGLAATVVLVSHGVIALDFALFTGRVEHSHGAWDVGLSGAPFSIVSAGDFAVCVFFVLSGFVLTHAFSRALLGSAALAAKRYIRLALPVLAACLLSYSLLAAGVMQNHAVATITHSSWLDAQMRQSPSLLDAVREGAFGAFFCGFRFDTT